MYQPKVWTTSFVSFVFVTSCVSSPTPLSEPRDLFALIPPPSLCPNCMRTKSPGLSSARTFSHKPSVKNVRLLRPPSARLRTRILFVSKCAAMVSPQPCKTRLLLRTVESPMSQSVGCVDSEFVSASALGHTEQTPRMKSADRIRKQSRV